MLTLKHNYLSLAPLNMIKTMPLLMMVKLVLKARISYNAQKAVYVLDTNTVAMYYKFECCI